MAVMKPIIFYICLSVSLFAGISRHPYLQNGSPDSMTIMWRTKKPTIGKVEFGKDKSYGSIQKTPAGCLHKVKLTGLSPDTKYFYKVTSDGDSQSAWFRTFPISLKTPVTFAVSGDFQSKQPAYIKRLQALSNKLLMYEPFFTLQVGDICLNGEELTSPIWQSYFDGISRLISHSAFYLCTGNHDYNNSTKELSPGYFDNFCLPKNGPDKASELVYSFDCGNVCVIVGEIHPNTSIGYLPGSDQFAFITNKLSTTDKPWKVFMTHNPIFDSGRCGVWGRDKWNTSRSSNMWLHYVPQFEAQGLNLFISGHDHFYERSIKSNVTYVLSSVQYGYKHTWKNPYSVVLDKRGGSLICSTTGNYMYCSSITSDSAGGISFLDNFILTNNIPVSKSHIKKAVIEDAKKTKK